MSRLSVLCAAGLLAIGTTASAQTPPQQESVIVAQGEAVLTVAPDRAFVSIAAEGRAQKTADAQQISAQAMTSVQNALKRLGLPADAIKTTGYIVQPEYDYNQGRQTFRDYLARNTIEVRVDDISKLADVIDASGSSGAASMSSLRFDVKNRSAVELDALKKAVQDATQRAQAIAAGAGKTVGNIVRIQEQRVSGPSAVRYDMAGGGGGRGGLAAVSTPVTPGEIELRAIVMLTVAIK